MLLKFPRWGIAENHRGQSHTRMIRLLQEMIHLLQETIHVTFLESRIRQVYNWFLHISVYQTSFLKHSSTYAELCSFSDDYLASLSMCWRCSSWLHIRLPLTVICSGVWIAVVTIVWWKCLASKLCLAKLKPSIPQLIDTVYRCIKQVNIQQTFLLTLSHQRYMPWHIP